MSYLRIRRRIGRGSLLLGLAWVAFLAVVLTLIGTTPSATSQTYRPIRTVASETTFNPELVRQYFREQMPPVSDTSSREAHIRHLEHLAHLRYLHWLATHRTVTVTASVAHSGPYPSYGIYTYSMLEGVWEWAGGPSWAAPEMAHIALNCESGGKTWAENPDGASGLWQILGVPFPGNPFDGPTNARMAVAKFRGDGDSYAPWAGDGCV